ncbi:replicative DNA helicase [Bradyrhizobium sp. LM6.10]
MALTDSNVLKLAPESGTPAYRSAPHNIEAEQSLLGAILVNNDAFYRVSDFLEPKHYFEPLHQTIFETASSLIRMGKIATPVTLKTFLPADTDVGGMTIGQYLARLAAEATTIINAQDYGRTIYDLALRRDLIGIGEDMVNVAYDAPVDFAPRAQIEDAERRLYELAESGRYDGGFQKFSQALTLAVDLAAKAFQRDGKLSGISTGLRDLDTKMGGLQHSDLIIVAGRPGMGKTSLATNIAYNVARAYVPELQADGTTKAAHGGVIGFFSCEMSADQLATRIVAERTGIPSSHIRRGGISEADFENIREVSIELQSLPFLCRRDRRPLDLAADGARPPAETAEGPRPHRHRLHPALVRLGQAQRKPRAGNHRDHDKSEGPGQGTERARDRALAALAPGGVARRQAAAALRSARIRLDRAGRRRRSVCLPRGILPRKQGAAPGHTRARKMAPGHGSCAWQGRSHHRQAAPRPDRHRRSGL